MTLCTATFLTIHVKGNISSRLLLHVLFAIIVNWYQNIHNLVCSLNQSLPWCCVLPTNTIQVVNAGNVMIIDAKGTSHQDYFCKSYYNISINISIKNRTVKNIHAFALSIRVRSDAVYCTPPGYNCSNYEDGTISSVLFCWKLISLKKKFFQNNNNTI